MNEFKKRQRLKKILYSRAIFVLLVIIALFIAHGVWGIFWKYRSSVADERQLQAKLASLTAEQTYLASSTAELGSKNGIEYALQEKFGAVLPGEKEIVFVSAATSSGVPTQSSGNPVENFFSRIFDWF